jgi:NCS2 family nucleobase:cation symporter-2
MTAMQLGGTELVMGMLMFAGLVQIALSQVMQRLRAYLPPEIGGLAVLMIGIIIGMLGMRLITGRFDVPGISTPESPAWFGIVTVCAIASLSVWAASGLKIYATLFGLIAGYFAAILSGIVEPGILLRESLKYGVVIPVPALAIPSFSLQLAPEFAIAALVCTLRAMGDLITIQRIEDPDWRRPDFANIRKGVLADGLGTAIGAGIGSPIGMNSYSASIGLAAATGTTARVIGYSIGAWMFALALLPGATRFFIEIPQSILGGVLMVAACYIIFNGFQVILSRMLDARRILTLGIPFVLGLSYDTLPGVFAGVPTGLQPLMRSDLMITVLAALMLNLVFRIGVSRVAEARFGKQDFVAQTVSEWALENGARWGARADVMRTVAHVLSELAEAREELIAGDGVIRFRMRFDEFRIDLQIDYPGARLDLDAADAADPQDLMQIDIETIEARTRSRLIRGLAGDARAETLPDGSQRLSLRFDH